MADRHAGYAAAVAISQRALDDLARALYSAGQFDHRLSGVAPGFLSDFSVSFDDIFLEAPTFELLQANQGKVGLRLHGWGPVTVTPNDPQQQAEGQGCEMDLLVRLTPRTVLVKGRLGIAFDAQTATLDGLKIRPFEGTSFSAASQTYLDSAGLRLLLELAIRAELARIGSLLPPFDVSFLGAVATDPSTRATLAVVDKAIVLGLDVDSGGVTTAGDKSQLINFLGDRDIGMWTNPVAVPVAFGTALRAEVQAMAASEGATLRAFSVIVEEGGVRVSGTVGQDTGDVTFSLLASPGLEEGDDPIDDQLRFAISQVQVSVAPAWWVVLLEVLTVGIVAAVVNFFATMIRSNIVNGITLAPRKGVAPLTIRFTLPGVPEPVITVRIVAFECHREGIYAGLTLSADFRRAHLVGPAVVAAEEVPELGMRPLVYRADLGLEAFLDDPTLRVRWTVRTLGSGAPLMVADDGVIEGRLLSLTGSSVPLLSSSAFRVECRLYRVFGSRVDEVFDEAITLQVFDRLSRALPYVRWTHQVLVPMVRRETDGSTTILGQSLETRHSKIHRTAIPGRCRMASDYSQSWIFFELGGPGPTLEYLSVLPFARGNLIANRRRVCDYCFFGGPTKEVPLIP